MGTQKKGPSPSIRRAIQKRGKNLSYIGVLHSNKNNKRLVISGLVAFVHLVLAEGNPKISGYSIERREAFASVGGETRKTVIDAEVFFHDCPTEWWEFKRAKDAGPNREGYAVEQLIAQSQAASEVGVKYRILTERGLAGKEVLFDNWLVLSGIIRRAASFPAFKEIAVLTERLQPGGKCPISSLLETPGCDPALMFAVIGRGLAAGQIQAELVTELITERTLIWAAV